MTPKLYDSLRELIQKEIDAHQEINVNIVDEKLKVGFIRGLENALLMIDNVEEVDYRQIPYEALEEIVKSFYEYSDMGKYEINELLQDIVQENQEEEDE